MADTYLTILKRGDGLYKDKGSRFLAFAEPVHSEDEVQQRLACYRKAYHDARHVCYAWMVGAERERFRMSDDGEPSGTAGRPIMGQINSRGLTNVLIVVVRYFGGILLGTGGLIVAYREAASDALDHTAIVQRDVLLTRTLRFPYEEMNRVMRLLKDTDSRIIRQDYEDGACVIECEIKKQHEGRIQADSSL